MFIVFLQKKLSWHSQKFKWNLMYLFCRFNTTRNLATMVYLLGKIKPAQTFLDGQNSLFPELNPEKAIAGLLKDGFYPNIELPQQIVDNIIEYIQDIDCICDHDGPRDPEPSISLEANNSFSSKCSRSRYDNKFQNCPTIQAIINDPKLLQIATDFLQVSPVFMGARLWWSHADSPPYDFKRAGQVFHYDIDDYRALRFFFYLTDVDSLGGHHVVIRGSHKHKKIRDKVYPTRFHSDDYLTNIYGSQSVIALYGQAGFGFAEDPYIFHKGTPPEDRDRLMLLIRYSMNDFGNYN